MPYDQPYLELPYPIFDEEDIRAREQQKEKPEEARVVIIDLFEDED